MEREITSSIQEYRSVIQPLWRTLSGYALEEYDWDLCDAFADLCDRIFQLTVLRPNGISGVKKARQYDQFPAEIPAFVCSPAPGASPRYYALLPADTTRVLFRPPRRAGGKGRAVSGNVRRKQSP